MTWIGPVVSEYRAASETGKRSSPENGKALGSGGGGPPSGPPIKRSYGEPPWRVKAVGFGPPHNAWGRPVDRPGPVTPDQRPKMDGQPLWEKAVHMADAGGPVFFSQVSSGAAQIGCPRSWWRRSARGRNDVVMSGRRLPGAGARVHRSTPHVRRRAGPLQVVLCLETLCLRERGQRNPARRAGLGGECCPWPQERGEGPGRKGARPKRKVHGRDGGNYSKVSFKLWKIR